MAAASSSSSSLQSTGAAVLLQKQLREMQAAKDLPGISVGLLKDSNVFEWEVVLMIDDECKYYGGESTGGWHLSRSSRLPPCRHSQNPRPPLTPACSPGAYFRAILTFPATYPMMPPKLVFGSPVPFHPNVYPQSGEVCISILHPPEEDRYGYESAAERWTPAQTPATILLSVISLFSEPNDESPANLDAAKLLRAERDGGPKEFRRRVRKCVRESLGED